MSTITQTISRSRRLLVLGVAALALGTSSGVAVSTSLAGHQGPTVSTAAGADNDQSDHSSSTTGKSDGAFGQKVKTTVSQCKANLPSGQHGIGDCVSDFTTTHNPSTTNGHKGH
ncbi:MAG TPA: hypothetical protein VF137_00490 [Candidatus Dormibacteraeota bacterium]